MKLSITDIAFIIFAVVTASWLIWEVIPDSTKKWWSYILQHRRDVRKNHSRRWTFSFNVNPRIKDE